MITKIQRWIFTCGFVVLLLVGAGTASASCVCPASTKVGCGTAKDAKKPAGAACKCCKCTQCSCAKKCECCKCNPCTCK